MVPVPTTAHFKAFLDQSVQFHLAPEHNEGRSTKRVHDLFYQLYRFWHTGRIKHSVDAIVIRKGEDLVDGTWIGRVDPHNCAELFCKLQAVMVDVEGDHPCAPANAVYNCSEAHWATADHEKCVCCRQSHRLRGVERRT